MYIVNKQVNTQVKRKDKQMPRGTRTLDNHIDKGAMHWTKYIEILENQGSSRLGLFMTKPLHANMATPDGYVRVETWSIKEGEETIQYKASVTFDWDFLVWYFKDPLKELGWIDGASFSRPRIEKLINLIEEDHGKLKEKEIEKALIASAENLVKAGLYTDVDKALEFIKSAHIPQENGKSKSKGTTKEVATV